MNFTMFRFSTTALMLSACQVASFSLNAGLATADDVAIAISSDEENGPCFDRRRTVRRGATVGTLEEAVYLSRIATWLVVREF